MPYYLHLDPNRYYFQVLPILLIIAAICFAVTSRNRKIRQLRRMINTMVSITKTVDEIEKDIKRAKSYLQNLETRESISVMNWYSKTDDEKNRIFKDYNELRNIDEFYKELKNRENSLSKINLKKLSEVNSLCYNKANVLTSIKWDKLTNDRDDRKYSWNWKTSFILGLYVYIIASVFLTYVCEIVPLSFVWPFEFTNFLIISIILRSFVSFFMVYLISSHCTRYNYDEYSFTTDKAKNRGIILLIISTLIMGLATTAVVFFWQSAYNVNFNLNYYVIINLLNSSPSSNGIYTLPTILLVSPMFVGLDIIRMILIALIDLRYLNKFNIPNHKLMKL
jgi:hypothetical protein